MQLVLIIGMSHSVFHFDLRRFAIVLGTSLVATLGFVRPAGAAMIIEDTFTGPDNTPLIGRMPAPTNVPGATYAGNGNVSLVGGFTGGTPYAADIRSNAARVGADAGLALNLGISAPQRFQLAITFHLGTGTETQAFDPHRGGALGFFSSVSLGTSGSSHGFNNFTGLTVDRAGSVRLIVGGTNSGIATVVGGFNAALNHTLSYTVDTATGNGLISNILLDGVPLSLSAPTDTFTVARTTYAGFYNSSGDPSGVATFDNFSVAIVPEPSAVIGVTCLIVCMALVHLRKRSRAATS